MKQTVPTVHLNGTSAESLLEAYDKAGRALALAQAALEECSPHARDYYPQGTAVDLEGNDAFDNAHNEHLARCNSLANLRAQLIGLTDSVRDQLTERNLHRTFSNSVSAALASRVKS